MPDERAKWVRRARLLAWLGLGWHGIEAATAIIAGVVAGSVALMGFGADSVVEAIAAFVVIWRFSASHESSEEAEQRAQKLIAASFFLIAVYVAIDAIWTLLAGNAPEVSWLGIGLAAITTITMPLLAKAKARVGNKLGSSAAKSERGSRICYAHIYRSPCWWALVPTPSLAGGGSTPSQRL